MTQVSSLEDRMKFWLEMNYNIKPDLVYYHGTHSGRGSFILLYHLNRDERMMPGDAAESIRSAIKEQVPGLKVTKAVEYQPGRVRVNVTLATEVMDDL